MLALVHPLTQHPDSHRSSTSTRQSARHPRILSNPLPSSSSRSSSSTSTSTSTRNLHTVAKPPPPPPVPSTSTHPAPPPPTPNAPSTTFDIHSYPSTELLRLLASLLTQIASTNDKLSSPHSHPHSPSNSLTVALDTPIWQTLTTASRTSLSNPSSTLTFHARNIPTISLEAYLLRILKYCPTTNEVFLSLLVYFDRMSKLAGEATGRTFVIDSFNVHRLVIAGVTVASKFFSDVFYTNSRYAKVGGLPQAELNQLELQFLLLNDFRLVISSEEMQRYAEQLIVFSSSTPLPTPPIQPQTQPPSQTHQKVQPSSHTQLQHRHSSSHVPGARSAQQPQYTTNGVAAAPMQAMGAVDAYGGRISTGLYPSSVSSRPPSSSSSSASSSSSSSSASSHPTHSDHKTPSVRPKILGPYQSAPTPTPTPTPTPSLEDGESENDTGADTETETETEGGWTTDDETTIRAGCSSAESESDSASLCSTGTEDGDGLDDDDGEGELEEDEEGREVEIGDVFEGGVHLDRQGSRHRRKEGGLRVNVGEGGEDRDIEGKGERTPEQKWKVWEEGQVHVDDVRGETGDYAMASP